MKKQDAIKFIEDSGYDAKTAIAFIEEQVKKYCTSWQAIELDCILSKTRVKYIHPGYRKNTTGEYVPNAYLANFGWKNTYYQQAKLEIDLSIRDFHPDYIK